MDQVATWQMGGGGLLQVSELADTYVSTFRLLFLRFQQKSPGIKGFSKLRVGL